jgi:hypothetical protein
MEQLADDDDLREQAKQTFAKSGDELRELQQLCKKKPEQMTAHGTFSLFGPSNLIVAEIHASRFSQLCMGTLWPVVPYIACVNQVKFESDAGVGLTYFGRPPVRPRLHTELHKMITIQRDLLRNNPEKFWQQAAKNPQLKDMSREVWAGRSPNPGHRIKCIYWRRDRVMISRSAATDHATIDISK